MDHDHNTKVYVTCSQKGGVGKTTTTVNLAATDAKVFPPTASSEVQERLKQCLSRTDEEAAAKAIELLEQFESQVLAVSTDPQGSMTDWLAMVEKVHRSERRPMPMDYAQEDQNPRVLAKLKKLRRYRRIYADSPGWIPSESDDPQDEPVEKSILRSTLESADVAIVPIEPEPLAFKPTRRTIDEVIKPLGVPFIVVINNWDPRDGRGDLEDTRDMVRKHGWPLAQTVIRRYKVHTSASAAGRICTTYPPNRKAIEANQDYTELGLEIAAGGF